MKDQQFEILVEMMTDMKKAREEDRAELKEFKLEWQKAREEDNSRWQKAREEDRKILLRELDDIKYLIKNETEERRRIEEKVDAVYDMRKSIEIQWNSGFIGLNAAVAAGIALFVSFLK